MLPPDRLAGLQSIPEPLPQYRNGRLTGFRARWDRRPAFGHCHLISSVRRY
jgi:hypothetical protein